MSEILNHYIAGQSVAGRSGRQSPVYNPALGEVCAQVPLASVEEVDAAVGAAAQAFPGWAATTPLRLSLIHI